MIGLTTGELDSSLLLLICPLLLCCCCRAMSPVSFIPTRCSSKTRRTEIACNFFTKNIGPHRMAELHPTVLCYRSSLTDKFVSYQAVASSPWFNLIGLKIDRSVLPDGLGFNIPWPAFCLARPPDRCSRHSKCLCHDFY